MSSTIDGDQLSERVTKQLQIYFQDGSDAKSIAAKLVEAVEASVAKDTDPNDISFAPHPIYKTILSQIRLVKHDDALQNKAVALLKALQTTEHDNPTCNWKELEPFGLLVRELWNGELKDNSVDSWASLNAFVARVTEAELSDFTVYGIWALRYALEDAISPGHKSTDDATESGGLNTKALDAHVPAAAVWVIYAGKQMWTLSQSGAKNEAKAKGGPKWTGEPGYSVERWNMWSGRFKAMGEREDLSVLAKGLSKEAHGTMKDVAAGSS